jgi:hypothetical protein
MAKRQSKRRSNKRNEHGVDDAIALLSADHRRVEELFAQWEGQSSKAEKQKLVKEVCDALIVHALLASAALKTTASMRHRWSTMPRRC